MSSMIVESFHSVCASAPPRLPTPTKGFPDRVAVCVCVTKAMSCPLESWGPWGCVVGVWTVWFVVRCRRGSLRRWLSTVMARH